MNNSNQLELFHLDKNNNPVYMGIKYAKANRFEKPIVLTYKEEERPSFSYCSIQKRTYNGIDENNFYDKEFRMGLDFHYQEDSLYMNIYTPKEAKNVPVVIYIHGGNFTKCSNMDYPFDGSEYSKRNVIVVTINYRLNIFGFISDGSIPYNLGIHDIKAAIDFVKNNIALFGGNPNSISLMGQSAGAMAINALLIDEETRNNIKNVILLSGANSLKGFFGIKNKSSVDLLAMHIASFGGVQTINDLKNKETEELYKIYESVEKKHPILSMMALGPVMDNNLFKKTELRKKEYLKTVPILIGTVKKDILNVLMQNEAKNTQKRCKKAYRFIFEHELPGDDKKSFHSCDLWYEFGGLNRSHRPFNDEDERIKDDLISSFVSFIKTDNPNYKNEEQWLLNTPRIIK